MFIAINVVNYGFVAGLGYIGIRNQFVNEMALYTSVSA
jgi:hypothetical protein